MSKVSSPVLIIKARALREVFDTHQDLTEEEKNFAIKYIYENILLKTSSIDSNIPAVCSNILPIGLPAPNSNSYTNSHPNSHTINNPHQNNSLLSESSLTFNRFLLYTNKNTTIGRFCLSYNEYLDYAIKMKDTKIITNMITGIQENAFIELFDNKLLSEEEKSLVKKVLNRELSIINATMEQVCKNQDISSNILTETNSVYSEYYKNSFLSEKFLHYSSRIPKKIYVKDKIENKKIPMIYMFDYFELIGSLSSDSNMNIQSEKPFNERVYNSLIQKFEKEIKLYKRYLKGKVK